MECNLEILKKALKLAKLCTDAKSTMPVLGDIVISADKGVAHLKATDLTTETHIKFASTGKLVSFPVSVVHLHKLLGALKNKGEPVSLDRAKGKHVLEVKCGKRRFSLQPGINLAERPKPFASVKSSKAFPHVKGSLDGDLLLEALKFILPAVCADETRFHLNCMAWLKDRLVATDGHRLHLWKIGGIDGKGEKSATDARIMPKTVAALIQAIKILRPCYVMIKQSGESSHYRMDYHIEGDLLDVLITERKARDGHYPPIDQVIPTEGESFSVVGSELLDAARTAKPMIECIDSPEFKLHVEESELTVKTNSFDETLTVQRNGSDELEAIGLNVTYLIDALGLVKNGGAVTVQMSGPLEPVLIKYATVEGALAVIMPQRDR